MSILHITNTTITATNNKNYMTRTHFSSTSSPTPHDAPLWPSRETHASRAAVVMHQESQPQQLHQQDDKSTTREAKTKLVLKHDTEAALAPDCCHKAAGFTPVGCLPCQRVAAPELLSGGEEGGEDDPSQVSVIILLSQQLLPSPPQLLPPHGQFDPEVSCGD